MIEKENKEVELELIISGDVQGVGYRQYTKRIGRKLNIKGSVKNLEDNTVQIQCKGEKHNIDEFKDKIKAKNPLDAPFIDVDEIYEKSLPQGTIKETTFIVKFGETNVEVFEGNTTGMNYLNWFRSETDANFKKMDKNARMEKTEKNIESLLKVLTEKKT